MKSVLRKTLAVLPLAAACAVFGSVAQAQTITINGNLKGATCTPSVTGGSVTLPDITLGTDLLTGGSSAKETPFTVSLSGCGAGASGLKGKIYFWQSQAYSSGVLAKTSGTGSGWSYQFLYGASGNTPLTVGSNSSVLSNTNDPGVTLGTAPTYNVTYRVRYYRLSTNTQLVPGNVGAVANMVFYAM